MTGSEECEFVPADFQIDPRMIEPMTRADERDYVPLCSAIHWIMTKGGIAFGRFDDSEAWDSAVGKLMKHITLGDLEIVGRARDQGTAVPIAPQVFSDIPVPSPFPWSVVDLAISAPSHIACVPYGDEARWEAGANDKLYEQGESLEAWSRLQVKKSRVLALWSKPSGKAVNESNCRKWLADQMRASMTSRPKRKKEFLSDALQRFPGIGPRQFVRAWEDAIAETGARAWSKAGAPKKQSNHRTN
jgi:hypothetical protein